jgi:hypothetical protein
MNIDRIVRIITYCILMLSGGFLGFEIGLAWQKTDVKNETSIENSIQIDSVLSRAIGYDSTVLRAKSDSLRVRIEAAQNRHY